MATRETGIIRKQGFQDKNYVLASHLDGYLAV